MEPESTVELTRNEDGEVQKAFLKNAPVKPLAPELVVFVMEGKNMSEASHAARSYARSSGSLDMETGLLCFGSCMGVNRHTPRVQSGRSPKWSEAWKFPLALDQVVDGNSDEEIIRLMSGVLNVEVHEEVVLDPNLFQSRTKSDFGRPRNVPQALQERRDEMAKTVGLRQNQQPPLGKDSSPVHYASMGTVSIPLPLVFSSMSKQKYSEGGDMQNALSFKCPPTWFSIQKYGSGGGGIANEERQGLPMVRVGLKLQGVRESKYITDMFRQMRQLCTKSRHLGSGNGILTRASIKDLVRNNQKLQRDGINGSQTQTGEMQRLSGKDRFRSSVRREKTGEGSRRVEGESSKQQQDGIVPYDPILPELPVVSVAVMEGRGLLAVNYEEGDSDPICVCRIRPYEYEEEANKNDGSDVGQRHPSDGVGTSYTSTMISKTINPRWNFKCSFPLSDIDIDTATVEEGRQEGSTQTLVTPAQHQAAVESAISKIRNGAIYLYVRDEDLLDVNGSSSLPEDVSRLKRCREGLAEGILDQEPDAHYTPMGFLRLPLRTVISKGTLRKYSVGDAGNPVQAEAGTCLSCQMPPNWFDLEVEGVLGMRFVKGQVRVAARVSGLRDSPAIRDAILAAKSSAGSSRNVKRLPGLH